MKKDKNLFSCGICGDEYLTIERLSSHQCRGPKRYNPKDTQIGGDHYQRMKIQPIEFILKNNLSYCQGNIIKYICRYPFKNHKEDLLKIKQYIDFIIQEEYPGE